MERDMMIWEGTGRLCVELTVDMNHNNQSCIMQTSGLVKLKRKAAECSKN